MEETKEIWDVTVIEKRKHRIGFDEPVTQLEAFRIYSGDITDTDNGYDLIDEFDLDVIEILRVE